MVPVCCCFVCSNSSKSPKVVEPFILQQHNSDFLLPCSISISTSLVGHKESNTEYSLPFSTICPHPANHLWSRPTLQLVSAMLYSSVSLTVWNVDKFHDLFVLAFPTLRINLKKKRINLILIQQIKVEMKINCYLCKELPSIKSFLSQVYAKNINIIIPRSDGRTK